MIQATTLQFLRELKENNHKEWFDDNRKAYESAKKDFLNFTQELIDGLGKFDQSIAEANLEAKNCILRLNRDVRFSKDKSPYKTNFFAMISRGGRKSNYACYYLQLQPENTFVGGGVYMPMPPELQKFRQEIDYNFEEWQGILKNSSFQKTFPNGVQSPETLSRPPKGFEENNPAIEYLKMKGFYTWKSLSDNEIQAQNAIESILKNLEVVMPMIDFLNRSL
jgi:uncharacterized protein (TIGR02453 family)